MARVLLGREEVAMRIRQLIDQATGFHKKKLALDVACGTGIVTRQLQGCADEVCGIDVCPSMLDFARKTNDPSIAFDQQDFHALQADDGSVDIYTMAFARRYIRDLDLFMKETGRVLSTCGIGVLASSIGKSDSAELHTAAERHRLSVTVVRPPSRHPFNILHRTAYLLLQKKWRSSDV